MISLFKLFKIWTAEHLPLLSRFWKIHTTFCCLIREIRKLSTVLRCRGCSVLLHCCLRDASCALRTSAQAAKIWQEFTLAYAFRVAKRTDSPSSKHSTNVARWFDWTVCSHSVVKTADVYAFRVSAQPKFIHVSRRFRFWKVIREFCHFRFSKFAAATLCKTLTDW